MARLRWGVMGTGGIAGEMAGTLRAVGSDIVTVGSARPGEADRFAARWDIPLAVASHRAVAEVDEVDIVYVATTNDLHHRSERSASRTKPACPVRCNRARFVAGRAPTRMQYATPDLINRVRS